MITTAALKCSGTVCCYQKHFLLCTAMLAIARQTHKHKQMLHCGFHLVFFIQIGHPEKLSILQFQHSLCYFSRYRRGRWKKFANSPPCACHGSTGQKPYYGLMALTLHHFTAVLLLIYGSLFLSGICYCLRVFWCAAARMSELELEQRTNIKFLVVSWCWC